MRLPSMLRLGLLALLWGSNFLLIAVALDGFSPFQILAARLVLGALVLVVILLLAGQRLPSEVAVWGHLLFAAVLGNVVPYYLFAWAEQTVASSLAGVLNATTPLFTLAIAVASRQEPRVTIDRVAGLAIGFAGVVVIMAPWQAGALGSLAGQLGVLTASACYGVVFVYQRRFLTGRGTPPLALAAGQMVTGSVVVALATPVILASPVTWSLLPVVSLVLLATLGTGVAYAINFRLIQDEGATNASTVTYLLPVVAVVLGALFLAERITINVVLGTLVVFVGIALAQQRLRLPGRKADATAASSVSPVAPEGLTPGGGAHPDQSGDSDVVDAGKPGRGTRTGR